MAKKTTTLPAKPKAVKKVTKHKVSHNDGRRVNQKQRPVEIYAKALMTAEGSWTKAAALLDVSVTQVRRMCKQHDDLAEIRQEAIDRRVQKANDTIDEALDAEKNKDLNLRLRAAIFTLNTQSDEHTQNMNLDGNLNVALPQLQPVFVKNAKAAKTIDMEN